MEDDYYKKLWMNSEEQKLNDIFNSEMKRIKWTKKKFNDNIFYRTGDKVKVDNNKENE